MSKILAVGPMVKAATYAQKDSGFKDALMKKKALLKKETQIISNPQSELKVFINNFIEKHDLAVKDIAEVLNKKKHSPEKLLKIQYKTGVFFLREQMLSKTAELLTNTLKTTIQMQV